MVEFALVLPFLLVILLFALDVGRLFSDYVAIQNAAREAAAYASTSTACRAGGTTCTDAGILAAARRETGGDTSVTVTQVSCSPACSKSSGLTEYRITVALSRPFALVPAISGIPGPGGASFPTITLGSSATAVLQ